MIKFLLKDLPTQLLFGSQFPSLLFHLICQYFGQRN
jgi:hypothetical protein